MQKHKHLPVIIKIIKGFIWVQIAFALFQLAIFLIFMWLPGDAGSAWHTYRERVLSTAFGITGEDYSYIHVYYTLIMLGMTFMVLTFLNLSVTQQRFIFSIILGVLLILLTLGNPIGIALAAVTFIMIVGIPQAREYIKGY